MAEACTLTNQQGSFSRAGSKIISSLREDASKKILIMLDSSQLTKMRSSSKRAEAPTTLATAPDMKVAGKTIKRTAQAFNSTQIN